jgi:hypothetical protein
MRPTLSRALAATALAAATLLAASACSQVDLVNEWPSMAEPTGWEPKVGACTNSFAETSYRSAYSPVDCNTSHTYETVYIGQFKGAATELTSPPARGSTAFGGAWSECDTKTTEFLGGDWRGGKIWISVSVPSSGSWEGGARWFRCEAATTIGRFTSVGTFSKSLKGEFSHDSELKFGCFQVPDDDNQDVVEKKCNEGHNAEYVGVFISNDNWDDLKNNRDSVHQKCRSLIAGYVGVPDDGNMKYRSGSYYSYPSKKDWDAGDHGIRCHLYMGKKVLTSSLKGGGTKALPLN